MMDHPVVRRARPFVVALAALLAAQALAPKGLPTGIIVLGLMLGGLSSLLALGLVLIYRANRFVNFAHGPMGLVAGVVTAELVAEKGVSFWLAMPLGVAAGAGIGVFTERSFVARLARAPRVIVMVASIGLAQLFGGFQALIPILIGNLAPNYQVPLGIEFEIFPVRFSGSFVFTALVVPVCLLGLAAFLRLTRYGIAVRALAQNEERARSLGVPARRVSLLLWAIAGAFAAVGGILTIPLLGFNLQGTQQGPSVFLLALAAAVVGRMYSLPTTFFASLGLGVAYQGIYWNTARSSYTDLVTLVVILVALALQSRGVGRVMESLSATSWDVLTPVRPVPPELARLPVVRWGYRGAAAVVLLGAVAVPAFLSPSQAQIYGVLIVFAMAAVAVAVVSGFGGQITLGHWAVVGVGAFVGSQVVGRVGFVPGLVVAAAAAAAVSVLIGLPALRISGLFYAVTTLAFAVPAQSLFFSMSLFGMDTPIEAPSLFGWTIESNQAIGYVALALLVLAVVAVHNLRSSTWGREIIATRENERVAAAHGLATLRAKLLAYAVSGAIAGVAGYVYLFNQRLIDAQSFAADRSLMLLTMVVVGGLGSVPGAIMGALAVQTATLVLDGSWELLGTGVGLLLVVLFLPGGLSSLLYRGRDALLAYVARRQNVAASGYVGGRAVTVGLEQHAEVA